MNVKNAHMRRLQKLLFIWPLSPLGQNPMDIGYIELPLGLFSPCAPAVPGSSQSNKA